MTSDILSKIELTLKSLRDNHFDAHFAETASEARQIMLEMIPKGASVGVGDSATLKQIGILDELVQQGNKVTNPFTEELTRNYQADATKTRLLIQTCRSTFGTDVFITSSNAITQDGKVVSIDYAGNRVAGMIYGAPKVILAVGKNKIVNDFDEAIHRIKNVIAPEHAKRRGRKTPCAITGSCNDCDHKERICNVTVVLEKKPAHTDLSIIMINEDLGLGWDPAWDTGRINEIRDNYYQHTWTF